jgi:putative transposase
LRTALPTGVSPAFCADGADRPVILLLTEGQMSDHKGAALIYPMLPDAETIIADKGYDSDAF